MADPGPTTTEKREVEAPTIKPIARISSDTMIETQLDGHWIGFGPLIPLHTANASSQEDTKGETSRRGNHEFDCMGNNLPTEKTWIIAVINAIAQRCPSSPLSMLAHPQITPACLSYQAQHTLLARARVVLEKACSKYEKKNMSRCDELHVESKAILKDKEVPYPTKIGMPSLNLSQNSAIKPFTANH
ncbi:hypothetical protein CSPAE12_00083 [Colletotrichum incanum]|nr:hypothetical protein CSPAE12_00083 [Colletotrichum incanum]